MVLVVVSLMLGVSKGTNQGLFLIVQRKLAVLIMVNHIGSLKTHGVHLLAIKAITKWRGIPILLKLVALVESLAFLLNYMFSLTKVQFILLIDAHFLNKLNVV